MYNTIFFTIWSCSSALAGNARKRDVVQNTRRTPSQGERSVIHQVLPTGQGKVTSPAWHNAHIVKYLPRVGKPRPFSKLTKDWDHLPPASKPESPEMAHAPLKRYFLHRHISH